MKQKWPLWKMIAVNSIWQVSVLAIMLSCAHWLKLGQLPEDQQPSVVSSQIQSDPISEKDEQAAGAANLPRKQSSIDFVDFSLLRPRG